MTTRLPNPYDSDGAHRSQPVLSLPPAAILEAMVAPGNECYEDVLGNYNNFVCD